MIPAEHESDRGPGDGDDQSGPQGRLGPAEPVRDQLQSLRKNLVERSEILRQPISGQTLGVLLGVPEDRMNEIITPGMILM